MMRKRWELPNFTTEILMGLVLILLIKSNYEKKIY